MMVFKVRKRFIIAFTLILTVFLGFIAAYNYLPGKITNYINYKKCQIIYTIKKPPSDAKPYKNAEKPSESFHTRYVKPDIPLSDIIKEKGIAIDKNINIHIDMSTRTLSLRYKDSILKEYRISAGAKTYQGDKEKEGDYRTPRGDFYICTKVIHSPPKGYLGSRWMLLSYPNTEAAQRGLQNKDIDEETFDNIKYANLKKRIPPQDTPLGSAIGIHGGAKPSLPKDWTAGCIGMYDQDVEEIFEYVKVGTKVVIK